MGAYTLLLVIERLFNFYNILIVVYCLLSWVPMRPGGLVHDIASVIARVVEPYLGLFRRFVPPVMGMDFSPVLAIVALSLIERALVTLLW